MIIKIAITAITGAFQTAQLKSLKPEYGQVLLIGMGVFLFFFALSYLDGIKEMIEALTSMITVPKTYLTILIKMVGIAYVCEFASNLCKDAGCQTIGSQVEMIGKLSIIFISVPVVTSLIDVIGSLF